MPPIISIASFLLLAALASSDGNPPYSDRECGATLEKMWLEIVFVVDNSMGMTNGGLGAVAASMETVLNGITIGTDKNNPQTTRVGIVTYNRNATIVADLNTFTSYDNFVDTIFSKLSTVADVTDSYLSQGLSLAEQVLQDGHTDARNLYKKVVIVFASTYSGNGNDNPIPVANRLKSDGIAIVTVAYAQNNEGALLAQLSNIASARMNFNNTDPYMPTHIQEALLQVNCFCPNGWTHYQESFSDPSSKKYGICIKTLTLSTIWIGARSSCFAQFNGAYLVNEYTQHKHDFVLNTVSSNPVFTSPYQYHIGLSFYNNKWMWEQPSGASTLPLSTSGPWNPGYPMMSSTQVVVMNSMYGSVSSMTGWQNIARSEPHFYVCEVKSCDTDNYCSTVDN